FVGAAGDDTLVGDEGADYAVGGVGTDTCSTEFTSGCES
ncbi:MAG: hypothetical protein LC713_08170, partial [Actinobacteria bacterium]|nr:hypothetical protein [Actinomycetota bacterium]